MDSSALLTSILVLFYLGATVYIANYHLITGQLGWLLRTLLYTIIVMALLFSINILLISASPEPFAAEMSLPPISMVGAITNVVFAVAACGLSLAVMRLPQARLALRRVISTTAAYNPDSPVHLTAIVLSLTITSVIIGQLVASGGLEGLAQTIETTGISPGEIIFQALLFVMIALLGVGMALRRSLPQAAERLGLRLPTGQDWRMGLITGIGLYGFVMVIGIIWVIFTPPEQLAEQTAASQELSQAINTLGMAFLVSICAAVGEEIFFRGAIQPIFGLTLTSIFFALIHTQYTLTPAFIIIWVVAFALGWVRARYSTTTAIIAHFAYNFIQLALAVLASSVASNM